jgi:ketosteroid isomerase-like protein
MFSEDSARELIDKAHAIWSSRNVDELLTLYDDDLTYWCNVGGPDGGPHVLRGKAAFKAALDAFLVSAECVSKVQSFVLHDPFSPDPVGKATVYHRVVHVPTRNVLEGTFRQIVTFRQGKILRLDEYHDEARMKAFWQLVADTKPPQRDIWSFPAGTPAPKRPRKRKQ